MNLKSFLKKFDTPNSIVLLEGKRDVVAGDAEKMRALGKLLTEKSTHILFRSGNAKGADDNFSKGVTSVDSTRLQIIKPYASHRKGEVDTYNIISLEDVNVVSDSEVV